MPFTLRHLKAGFAGESVATITYSNGTIRQSLTPEPGTSGAYLFVIRARDARRARFVLTVTDRSGTATRSDRDGPGRMGG